MAKVKDMQSGQEVHLLPHHSIGRRRNYVDSYFDVAEISNIHAVIEWDGQQWYIKDHSRNGTWVDGNKLENSRKVPLSPGQVISFACSEKHYLLVTDVSPPCNLLVAQGQEITLQQYNLLPSEDAPEVLLYQQENSGCWYFEQLNEDVCADKNILDHGQVITFAGQQWTAFLPELDLYTVGLGAGSNEDLQNYEFIFQVSPDEESVSLSIKNGSREIYLGTKIFFCLLVYLARKRIEDSDAGMVDEDQGWVKTALAIREIGLQENHLNIHIYRLRSHLSKLLPGFIHQDIVLDRERRGSIRIGIPTDKLTIKGGAVQEKIPSVRSNFSSKIH